LGQNLTGFLPGEFAMGITRRNFVTQLTVGLAGLALVHGMSWAQVKGKLGYMKIVDNAAMFVAMEKRIFQNGRLGT
jgi:ABC-type nitrate/sulfonate/bicarbonate transport system substrate-binding protein